MKPDRVEVPEEFKELKNNINKIEKQSIKNDHGLFNSQ